MSLKLFNTMGKKLEEFKPLTPGFCGFYGCGPTVYNYAHIGNLRAYVFLDLLDRTMQFLGYKVKHVMNITDVGHLTGDGDDGEDKMKKTAEEKHQSVLEVAKFYTDAFMADIDALNIRHPDVICKATEHIDEMIELIKKIEANGHTYMAGGNLYFDISTYDDYGKLANLNLDELKAGAGRRNVVVIDENKRNPGDFVLWFTKSKFEDQAMTWDSPWGRGYPGWHIECSAMSMKYLGKHFDIHTGGIDHVPVHHTNEIAQSECSFSEEDKKAGPWVKYWLHNEFLVIEGGKMSKSNGHFITLQTSLPEDKGFSLKDKGYEALDYRFFLLGAHYRSQVAFSFDSLDSAKNARKALNQRVAKRLSQAALDTGHKVTAKEIASVPLSKKGENYISAFTKALEDDLSSPKALPALQGALKDKELSAMEALCLTQKMDSVFGLRLIDEAEKIILEAEKSAKEEKSIPDNVNPELAEKVQKLIDERAQAKKDKNFARADEIRNELTAMGIVLIDTAQGTSWKTV